MRLVICGNGFDLHHNLDTSYTSYKDYLLNNHHIIVKKYENLVKFNDATVDKWSDIEKSLEFDYLKLFRKYADQPFVRDTVDRISDGREFLTTNNPVETKIRRLTGFIADFTCNYLYEWISSIDTSSATPDLLLDPNDHYITFNYTDTLERLYNVPAENILYLHGDIRKLSSLEKETEKELAELKETLSLKKDIDCLRQSIRNELIRTELQFGAGVESEIKENEKLECWFSEDDEYQAYISSALLVMHDLIHYSIKQPSDNFERLCEYINNTNNIEEVVIMGHSILSVDKVYYSKVIVPPLSDKKWIFMVHDNKADEIYRFVNEMNIDNYVLTPW